MPIIHTVYLPPAIDLSTTSPAHNIRFRRVQPPHETESQLPPCPRRGLGDSLLGDLLLGVPPVPAASKRKAEADDAYLNGNTEVTAPWSGEQEQVKPPANLWPRTPRRRSRRLYPDESDHSHPAGGLSVLPAMQEDSILSLDTTVSNPSQLLPPSVEADHTSITDFPRWTVPLSRLVSLDVLLSHQRQRKSSSIVQAGDGRVHVIVCVTGTTAPAQRRTKEQRARGMDGTLWLAKWEVVAMAAGSGSGKEVGCEVRLWDKCALEYGEVVRRGDVVLIEHAEFRPGSKKDKPQLVLSSSNPQPKATVLYRTLPRFTGRTDYDRASPTGKHTDGADGAKMVPEDKALRPDLRMARSDPGVRRVADMARWFADWVGGSVVL